MTSWRRIAGRASDVLCVALFVLAALLLFFCPFDSAWMLHAQYWAAHPLRSIAQFAGWMICLASISGMVIIVRLSEDALSSLITQSILFVFIALFAIERLIGWAVPSAQRHWIQGLSSIVIAAGASIVLPRLRHIRRSIAVAQVEHDRFLASAESTLDDFYIFDGIPDAAGNIVDFRFSYINPNAERRLQVRRESLIGKILTEVRPFMISSGLIHHYLEVVRTGKPYTCEVFLDDEMIQATWLNVQVIKLGSGIAITSRDVTEHRRRADRVSFLAHFDQLTGLPNRTLLQERLEHAIADARLHDRKLAVFLLDIDNFKDVNDSFGHAGGDILLASVSKGLLRSVRATDTVARIGGDEFVVLLPDIASVEEVWRCGAQMIENTAEPVLIEGRQVRVTMSAGFSVYPDCGLGADELLKNADMAMYGVKGAGRNGLQIFSREREEGPERERWEANRGMRITSCIPSGFPR